MQRCSRYAHDPVCTYAHANKDPQERLITLLDEWLIIWSNQITWLNLWARLHHDHDVSVQLGQALGCSNSTCSVRAGLALDVLSLTNSYGWMWRSAWLVLHPVLFSMHMTCQFFLFWSRHSWKDTEFSREGEDKCRNLMQIRCCVAQHDQCASIWMSYRENFVSARQMIDW